MVIEELKTKMFGTAGNSEAYSTFFDLLELPDEQFDAAYPSLKTAFEKAFTVPSTRKSLIDALSTMDKVDIQDEREHSKRVIAEIKNDNELSKNKKEFLIELIKKSSSFLEEVVKNPRPVIGIDVVKLRDDVILPKYAHDSDVGADIYAAEEITLKPQATEIVPTGIKVAIPIGYEIQIRPRSGLSLKTKLRVANAPGTIDPAYRQEVGVIITNTGNLSYTIKKGDRIAQMVVMPVPMIQWNEVDELDETDRTGGYGSTGQ